MFFNMQDMPPMRNEITSTDCIDNAIESMQADLAAGSFTRSFFVMIPEVADVPVECEEQELDYFTQLEKAYEEIQDLADVFSYLIDPRYPIGADTMGYYSCENPNWADFCF